MVLLGFGLSLLFRFVIFKDQHQHSFLLDILITTSITVAIWEGNLRLDAFLNKKLPWQRDAKKRIIVQLLTALGYNTLILTSSMTAYHRSFCEQTEVVDRLMRGSLVMSLFISFMLLAMEIGTQFFKHWKASLIEVEKYKTESAQAQLQNLKDQINPHFLFNNLSVLSSLVYKNQDKAIEFIDELSRVYRYVLDNRNIELVSISDEIGFLHHYIYLLQIRFGSNIQFHINMEEAYRLFYIPPMCLQMLVENAIKHNEVSSEHPLVIDIVTENRSISVSNPIRKRSYEEPSSKTGLQNIIDRYRFYSEEEVVISSTQNTFVVKLPLIEKR